MKIKVRFTKHFIERMKERMNTGYNWWINRTILFWYIKKHMVKYDFLYWDANCNRKKKIYYKKYQIIFDKSICDNTKIYDLITIY